MIKNYVTEVTNYGLQEGCKILSIEVPYQFIEDLKLDAGDKLIWEVDDHSHTAKIVKG